MSTPTRPIMRYYGGKWRMAPQIVARMPGHAVYVEPFGGAASVLLQKPRAACEVYNDLYGEVVNVFKMLRDCPETLLRGLWLTPYAREEYAAAYEWAHDPVERARRFIFRCVASIGTDGAKRLNGFRVSLNDTKNSTAQSWANLHDELIAVVERLRGVVIERRPAVELLGRYDGMPDALFYLDPPYVLKSRKLKEKGYTHEMSDADHEALLERVKGLKGKVMISGYPSGLYDAALKDWTRETLSGARDQTNERREEVLWMNFTPEGVLPL